MLQVTPENRDAQVPLCVDLDGTLVKTDTLVEQAFELLKRRPWYVFVCAAWLLKGRAYLKDRILRCSHLDVTRLPYHSELIEFLNAEHAKGRTLVLTTAANEQLAQKIAAHLGIFNRVIASDRDSNLKGREKLKRLREVFGERGFGYVCNSSVDLDIWQEAHEIIVVNAPRSVSRELARLPTAVRVFERPGNRFRLFLEAIRVHQWVKNLLLFVPVLLAHEIGSAAMLLKMLAGFFCFSFCASSVYILNDFLDLKADRSHPTKRRRPFASGNLDLSTGLILIPLLLLFGFGLGIILSYSFFVVLALYYLVTLGYSLYFKRVVLLDVSVLASLYMIRLFAGGALAEVTISQWLLAFSMFMFFSLAMVKRCSELYNAKQRSESEAFGRGYIVSDREQLATLGTASGYCAILVFALYLNSSVVSSLYTHPTRLWFCVPLIFYWISRIWLLAHRGQVNEDPIVFAIKDKTSYVIGALVACVFLSAL